MTEIEQESRAEGFDPCKAVIPTNILSLPRPLVSECVINPEDPETFVHAIVLPDMSTGKGVGLTREAALREATINLMINRATMGLDPEVEA